MYIWLMKIGLYIIFGSNVCFVGEKYCRESGVGSCLFWWIDSLLKCINILLGRNDILLGWMPMLLGWNLMLLGWNDTLFKCIKTLFGCNDTLLGWIDVAIPDIYRPDVTFVKWCSCLAKNLNHNSIIIQGFTLSETLNNYIRHNRGDRKNRPDTCSIQGATFSVTCPLSILSGFLQVGRRSPRKDEMLKHCPERAGFQYTQHSTLSGLGFEASGFSTGFTIRLSSRQSRWLLKFHPFRISFFRSGLEI